MKKVLSRGELIGATIYAVLYLVAVVFLFEYTREAILPEVSSINGSKNILLFFCLFIIVVAPIVITSVYDTKSYRRWARFLMLLIYLMSVVITVLSAFYWYLYPENPHWEAFTIINGFVTSTITVVQQSWKKEDRILSFFGNTE